MAKHKVSMDGYDSSKSGGGYSGPTPRRGMYDGRMLEVIDHTSGNSGNDGLRWKFEITKGEFKGWRGYLYSDFDNSLWKTQQIVHAITGSEKSITINTDDDGAALAKKSKTVVLRVITEKYEGETQAKIRSVLVMTEPDEDDDSEDEEEADEEDPFA